MIIVQGEIKTRSISSCNFNRTTSKWDVVYQNSEKTYSYAFPNVEWLTKPEAFNPTLCRIKKSGKIFEKINAIYRFKGRKGTYYHIQFLNQSSRDYKSDEIKFSETILKEKKAKNVFDYLTQLADINDLRNPETGEKILKKLYEKIEFIEPTLAISKYLFPKKLKKISTADAPIFPFGCNKSQYTAVKNALENSLSVIQGPPGTGKTQTILNIIANLLLQNKTILVVSNNNSALENVLEKLKKNNLNFVVASLGNSDNKKKFIEIQPSYPDFSTWMTKNSRSLRNNVRDNSHRLWKVFEWQERLAVAKAELKSVETEQKYFFEIYDKNSDKIEPSFWRKISSARVMELLQECQFQVERKNRISTFFFLKAALAGFRNIEFFKQETSMVIMCLQALFYRLRQKELIDEIAELDGNLNKSDVNLLNDLCEKSMILLRDQLFCRYKKNGVRRVFTLDDLRHNSEDFLVEYPVVLSTTFSSKSNLTDETTFDYVIMDEASQVDIATGALALACAENAVIVGDTKQLPHVVTEDTKLRAQAIFDSFSLADGYRFEKSFLQSLIDVIPEIPQVLLREHYRCHPKIINFCNQKFYQGQLIIMTEDRNEADVLQVVKTAVGNHARDHFSQRQIDVISAEVLPKLTVSPDEIGIITPYKNQVAELRNQLPNIDSATVHSFQGREKDAIIISTVDNEISDFTDDPYLLNVAVSRAKKNLVLVVSGNEQTPERNISDLISYVKYQNFEVTQSKTRSIFDYLYRQYSVQRENFLKNHRKISQYDSENLMFALIRNVLAEARFSVLDVVCHFPLNLLLKDTEILEERERKYALHPATHLDFLIFNRVSHQAVLVIEVDGYQYHKSGTAQGERDKMKDHILEIYGIEHIRFRTNQSSEKAILLEKLNNIIK